MHRLSEEVATTEENKSARNWNMLQLMAATPLGIALLFHVGHAVQNTVDKNDITAKRPVSVPTLTEIGGAAQEFFFDGRRDKQLYPNVNPPTNNTLFDVKKILGHKTK